MAATKARRKPREKWEFPGWSYVATVASENEPGATYDLSRGDADGQMFCACMAYRFARGEKTCKHLQAYLGVAGTVAHASTERTPVSASVGGEMFAVTRRAITFGRIEL